MTFTTAPWELHRASATTVLSQIDPSATPGWDAGKNAAREFMAERGALLSELQERLYAQGRAGGQDSVLLVVQGMDTAGKGGICRHVLGMVDPQGVALRSFGVPTPEEKRHHYLWRIRKALPEPGRIGVFDRSHYEDVLVVRVDELVPPTVWDKRYEEINRFEEKVTESGTTIVKVMLHLSKQEQGLRLMERLDRSDKHWKFNPNDVDSRQKWEAYQEAYQDVVQLTSTDVAPWYVVPADHKWYARLVVTELLVRALVNKGLTWPTPQWHVDVQRRRLLETMAPDTAGQAAENGPTAVAKTARHTSEVADMVRDFVNDYERVNPAPVTAGQGSETLGAKGEGGPPEDTKKSKKKKGKKKDKKKNKKKSE
ncbi:MAG: polyphosphate kinase 2 family protein [Bowdeniella nasicola]|nr:polyphosphate kinase 2 family protein [Bowdeniella nasicola]